MHELPIMQDIIKVANEEAEKNKIKSIKKITLVIGELSSVVDECAQMYFELLAEGTPCETAELVFKHISAQLKCSKCGNVFCHEKSFFCPICGSDATLIKGTGNEMYIESISD